MMIDTMAFDNFGGKFLSVKYSSRSINFLYVLLKCCKICNGCDAITHLYKQEAPQDYNTEISVVLWWVCVCLDCCFVLNMGYQ